MVGVRRPNVRLIQAERASVMRRSKGSLDFARPYLEAFFEIVGRFAGLGREVSVPAISTSNETRVRVYGYRPTLDKCSRSVS